MGESYISEGRVSPLTRVTLRRRSTIHCSMKIGFIFALLVSIGAVQFSPAQAPSSPAGIRTRERVVGDDSTTSSKKVVVVTNNLPPPTRILQPTPTPQPAEPTVQGPSATATMATMIPISDALQLIIEHTPVLGSEKISIHEAVGRVLAEDIVADMDLPPFDRSQMDGYAVQAADTVAAPVSLRIVGESAAGKGWHQQMNAGEAVRIMLSWTKTVFSHCGSS